MAIHESDDAVVIPLRTISGSTRASRGDFGAPAEILFEASRNGTKVREPESLRDRQVAAATAPLPLNQQYAVSIRIADKRAFGESGVLLWHCDYGR